MKLKLSSFALIGLFCHRLLFLKLLTKSTCSLFNYREKSKPCHSCKKNPHMLLTCWHTMPWVLGWYRNRRLDDDDKRSVLLGYNKGRRLTNTERIKGVLPRVLPPTTPPRKETGDGGAFYQNVGPPSGWLLMVVVYHDCCWSRLGLQDEGE